MRIVESSLATVLGSCALLAAFVITPAAQAQSNHPSSVRTAVLTSMESRSSYATDLEQKWRARGLDARVQLDGDSRDVLRVEWPTIHRSDIFGFVSSASARQARRMGFSNVVFTNGKQRWEYDLARESMVASPELF